MIKINEINDPSILFTLLQEIVQRASFEQLTPLTISLPQWQTLSTLNSQGGHSSGWQSRWHGCPHSFFLEQGKVHSGNFVPHG